VAKDGEIGDRKFVEGRNRLSRRCSDQLAVLEEGDATNIPEVPHRLETLQQIHDGLFALSENHDVDAVMKGLLDVVLDEVMSAGDGVRAKVLIKPGGNYLAG